jgi:hypothetical protein
VALGRVPGQPAASKMLEMVSDTQGANKEMRVETNELSRGKNEGIIITEPWVT